MAGPEDTRGSRRDGTLERALLVVGWIGLAVAVIGPVAAYPMLPAQVPLHFGAGGQVTQMGPRGSVLGLSLVALAVYGSLATMQRVLGTLAAGALSTGESAGGTATDAAGTEAALARGLGMTIRYLGWIKSVSAALFGVVAVELVLVGLGVMGGLTGSWIVLVGVLLAVVVVGAVPVARAGGLRAGG